MLKKKALTAVLTAVFVFGIGGMATEPVSTHEHSHIFGPAAAHASAIVERVEQVPQTLWKCYFCGRTTYLVRYSGLGADMRSSEPSRTSGGIGDEPCPHKHYNNGGRHCWVWVHGVPPTEKHSTYFYCTRCHEVDTTLVKNGTLPPTSNGCRSNNGGAHNWAPTGIIRTGPSTL